MTPVPRLLSALSLGIVLSVLGAALPDGSPAAQASTPLVGSPSAATQTTVLAVGTAARAVTAKTSPFTTAPVPTLKGFVRSGATLTLTPGTWSPKASFSYRWLRNGKAISGATGTKYTLTAADIGATISATVTGKASKRTTTTRTSKSTVKIGAAHFTTAPVPTISGTTRSGSTLTAKAGSWKPAPQSVTYRWLRNGTAIKGATAAKYSLVAADIGTKITVETTAKQANHLTTTKKSAATATISGTRFVATSIPAITGTARVASTLKANPGQWAPSPSFSYQWLRNGAAISGATSASYKPAAADIKAQLSVRVTATATGYEKTSSTSFATVPVAAQTFTTAPTPTISGTARSGSTLTAKTAAWAPAPTLKYQWLRGGTAISGATKSTYKLTKADRSRTITVKVTATKSGFTTASRTSAGVKVQAGVDAQMAYLHKHWNNYNTAQWGNLNSIGGDCANFVSQGLIARGWEMTPEWYSRNQSRDRSSSWGYVPSMDSWLSKNAKKYGATRLSSAERTKLKVGDIGMFDWNNNGVPDHTMTVSKVTTVNGKRKVYFISHNMDNQFRDLDYVSPSWPNTKVWFWSLPAE